MHAAYCLVFIAHWLIKFKISCCSMWKHVWLHEFFKSDYMKNWKLVCCPVDFEKNWQVKIEKIRIKSIEKVCDQCVHSVHAADSKQQLSLDIDRSKFSYIHISAQQVHNKAIRCCTTKTSFCNNWKKKKSDGKKRFSTILPAISSWTYGKQNLCSLECITFFVLVFYLKPAAKNSIFFLRYFDGFFGL